MPSNTVRGPVKPARASRAARRSRLRGPAGMHALGPAAVGEILDDAAGHGAGDAQRIDELARDSSRSAAPTPAAAPIAPNTAVGWKPDLCTAFGTTMLRRQMASAPTAMPRRTAAPSRPSCSASASTAGTMTAPACTGPPSKVSSKSSPCAAVPLMKAAPAAVSGRGVRDGGRRAGIGPGGARGGDVVGRARCDAEADDVDQQALAGFADGGRQPCRVDARRCARRGVSAMEGCGRPSQLFRSLTPPLKPGMRLAAMMTMEVRTSMVRPSTAMAARSPLSFRSKMRTDSTLVSDVNRITAADSSRTTATKMKHQVAIRLGPEQRRGDVAQHAQAAGAEDAARLLQLGRERLERRTAAAGRRPAARS